MSRWSGKCDFFDQIYMFSEGFENFKKETEGIVHIGLGVNQKDLRFEHEYELIPYWDWIVAAMSSNKEKEKRTTNIFLSDAGSYNRQQITWMENWNKETERKNKRRKYKENFRFVPDYATRNLEELQEKYEEEKKKFEESQK